MQETQVMPLSRFGEVDWFHRMTLEGPSPGSDPFVEVRLGRNAECRDHQYIVALSKWGPSPVDVEAADPVDGWAAKVWVPDYRLRIVEGTSTVLMSAAQRGACQCLLESGDPESTLLDDMLSDVAVAFWDGQTALSGVVALRAGGSIGGAPDQPIRGGLPHRAEERGSGAVGGFRPPTSLSEPAFASH